MVPGAILATKGYPRQQMSGSRQADLVCLVIWSIWFISFNSEKPMKPAQSAGSLYVGGLSGKA